MIFIGILDFLGVRGFLLRNSRIPYYVIYYVILGLDPRISIL